jgi:pimeloyl-ACP methyl ester carboxylesterase
MANDALLEAGLTAARAGDLETAALLFSRLVKDEPSSEQGWLGLAFCLSDKIKREYCFRRVLAINPENKQALQALGLLNNSIPTPLPVKEPQQPSAPAINSTESVSKPAPAVSPFLSEDESSLEMSEPAFMQTLHQKTVPKEAVMKEGQISRAPAPAEPVPEESKPVNQNPKPIKKNHLLAIVIWLIIITLLIFTAGVFYTFFSGKVTPLSQAKPVSTWTQVQLPTQTATPTHTNTPSATPSPSPTSPTSTPIPTPLKKVVYTPVFEKSACKFIPPDGVTVTCGYVSVPEDRMNPHSKTVQLAVAIFHSTNPNPAPDPVIFLQGGPGGEAVMLSAKYFDELVKPFLSKRDYIAFDQRGTGLSIPTLGCEELEKVHRQDIGGQIPASSRDYIYTNAFRSCHGAMTVDGIALYSYTTTASSDDLQDIVLALGYKQINLYGASYGTRLALVTMRDHPEIVRSAVLDSVVPVEVKLFNEDPIRYGSSLQALFDSCAADTRCNTAYPDLETVFWDLVDQLDAKPVKVTAPLIVGTTTENVDGAYLIGVTLGLLKTTKMIAYVPEIIYKIKSGDYSTFVAMQSSMPYEFDGINIGLYITMMCHEHILSTTPQDLQAAMDSQHNIGRYFRLPFFGDAQTIFDTCKVWGAIPPATGENDATISDIPTLIIEGKFDPATPPIFGQQVAANLSHSYYMEFPNQGHTPTATDTSGCAFGTMLAFIDNPVLKPNMTCLLQIKGVDFITP